MFVLSVSNDAVFAEKALDRAACKQRVQMRERFAEGGICAVFSECDEAYLLDLKGKRDASRVDNQDRIPIARKHPAADTASPAVLEIEPGEICAPYIVAKQATVAAKHGALTDEGGGRSARMKGGSL